MRVSSACLVTTACSADVNEHHTASRCSPPVGCRTAPGFVPQTWRIARGSEKSAGLTRVFEGLCHKRRHDVEIQEDGRPQVIDKIGKGGSSGKTRTYPPSLRNQLNRAGCEASAWSRRGSPSRSESERRRATLRLTGGKGAISRALPDVAGLCGGQRATEGQRFQNAPRSRHVAPNCAQVLWPSHVLLARTASIRKRTPWLSDGLIQSIRSKTRSASSN